MMTLMQAVTGSGQLISTTRLRQLGHSRHSIRQHLQLGELVPICTGWVGTRLAGRVSVLAVSLGGKLTGSTALASHGLWDADDRRVHLLLPPKSNGATKPLLTPLEQFVAPRFPTGPVVRHWRNELVRDHTEPGWRASIVDALRVVALSNPAEQFVASVDSCLHEGAMSAAALPSLRVALPARLRPLLDSCDGRAGSGLESICRLRFARLGCRVEIQVRMPGIARSGRAGAVDFLLDGWLVIEVDGDEFHDAASDRLRNSVIVRLGYRWHRFGYAQVMHDWPAVEATVRELLRYPPP